MSVDEPTISVVVPTRDRPDALVGCLDALEHQTNASFEVVVVDDASRDATAVAAIVARFSFARLVRGAGSGPAAARNLGVRSCRTRNVGFTDDDCRPGPDWLAILEGALSDGAIAVAGSMVAAHRSAYADAGQTITNHLTEWSRSHDGTSVRFAPTSNLAGTRDLFASVPFDERYPSAAGEDRDWCRRVAAAGAQIRFAADAWCVHDPDATFAGFWRQQLRYGYGAYRFHRSVAAAERRPPLRFYTTLARRAFEQGVAVTSLVALAQLATVLGYARAALADR